MDQEQGRIEEDLRGIVAGDVLCHDVGRSLYATDGSLFEEQPLAVVRPRSTDDVAAAVRWAAERVLACIHEAVARASAGVRLAVGW